ncbi:MAG: fibronectin type III domain-containing protein, partial [Aeromicrobium sp.]
MISTIPLRLFLATALAVVGVSFGSVLPAAAVTYAAPTGLKSTAHSASTVDLTWNAVTSAPRYRIQVATNSAMSGATYFRVTANKRQMIGLNPATKYFFKVRVITSDGVNLSPYSSAIAVTTSAAPPSEFPMSAPTGLKSTELASTMASLSWTPKSGAQKYRIQSSTNADMSGATYVRFTEARAQIGGLKPATKYFFKVRVITVDGVNQSPYSGSISATTKAATAPALTSPFNFVAKQKSTTEITATWSTVAGASKFQVQRSKSADMASPVSATAASNSATLTGLTADTTYFLRVRAVTTTGAVQGNFSSI